MSAEELEKKAIDVIRNHSHKLIDNFTQEDLENREISIFLAGYHECEKEHKGKCKTAYIKGVRTMANALKNYDRADGAWTDYFEHKVDEVLKRQLKESE